MQGLIRTSVVVALAIVTPAVGGLGGPGATRAEVTVVTPAPTPLPPPTPSPAAAALHSVSEPSAAMRGSRPMALPAVTATTVERPRGDVAPGLPMITYRVRTRGVPTRGLDRFAAVAQATLNDPRGWGAGSVRFQRVVQGGAFRLWLADRHTIAAADRTCSPRYSCRVGRDVFINAWRWRHGARTFADRSLHSYRQYVINHEVGHWLGLDHLECQRAGGAARVMQQQSISLDGCSPRVWPRAGEQRAVHGSLATRQ